MKPRETIATGMARPKTTALFFDKLWVHPALMEGNLKGTMSKLAVPAEVCLSNPLGTRRYYLACGLNVGYFYWDEKRSDWENYEIADLETHGGRDDTLCELFQTYSVFEFQFRQDRSPQASDWVREFGTIGGPVYGETSTKHRNKVINELVHIYAEKNIILTPIYLNPNDYEEVCLPEQQGLEICLDFVPVVVESELTWEQVLQFRKDDEARQKLDRLRRWFNMELLGKTDEEIGYILGKKLDDYQWALKKHGITTAIAGATSVISFVAGPAALGLFTSSPLTALAGGVALGSGAIAWVANRLVEKMEIQRDEVAFIYEVKKLKT